MQIYAGLVLQHGPPTCVQFGFFPQASPSLTHATSGITKKKKKIALKVARLPGWVTGDSG